MKKLFYKNSMRTTKKHAGFTIIEMLVSISIFMVIIVLGMTAVLSMINADRKSQSSTLVMSNLSLAIEAMSKDMRVGFDYRGGGDYITFTSSLRQLSDVTYRFDQPTHSIMRTSDGYTAAITAPEVIIQDASFQMNTTSGAQPSVSIKVTGHAGSKAGTDSTFYLQSLVSQRLIEPEPIVATPIVNE